MARAIAVKPDVILMNEPCSALDPHATLTVEARIDELKERYTIVIVTHNMQQAGRVADATVFLLDGELIEHGPTLEIFAAPKRRTHQALGERKVRVSAMLGPGSSNHLALAEQRRATRPHC
jgi:ABC-type phosphate transport system ATPase subunit